MTGFLEEYLLQGKASQADIHFKTPCGCSMTNLLCQLAFPQDDYATVLQKGGREFACRYFQASRIKTEGSSEVALMQQSHAVSPLVGGRAARENFSFCEASFANVHVQATQGQ